MITTLIVLGLIAVGLLLLYARSVRRRRTFFDRRLREAAKLGWYPAATDPWLAAVAARLYSPQGTAERMVAGFGIRALDFTYTASSTSTAAKCHVIAYDLPYALPPLTVGPKNPLVPGQEFESARFNQQFTVESADPRYASAVLNPRMMAMLVDDYNHVSWRIEGRTLVTWGVGYWTKPMVFEAKYLFERIVELIPPFVIEDYGAR
ncbi:hypothetical protein [Kribbella sp.]|uniref:hypothetical protein n=1 Tax=Kribbella sp. TaxID=1871183 RepID=UPI002D57118F|nr:hypothetical protein [Kribbella sp.]HZX07484.1 hypothetical protein [Kribbella sp.]